MAIRVRSVSSTRTLSAVRGSGVHSKERHVKAFQIAALELERTRKTRELLAARERIASLLERMDEVAALIRKYQVELGVREAGPASDAAGAPGPRRTIRYG